MTLPKLNSPPERSTRFLTSLSFDGEAIEGYVFDPDHRSRQFVVELHLDGFPTKIARADLRDDRLAAIVGIEDSRHGFAFALPIHGSARRAHITLANDSVVVGEAIDLSRAVKSFALSGGSVGWRGGLRLSGWLPAPHDGLPWVRCICLEEVVAEVVADRWMLVERGETRKLFLAFDADLPTRFADGRAHRIDVIDQAGAALEGSPLTIMAFEDGLGRFIERESGLEGERLRALLFDTFLPRAVPFGWVTEWLQRFPTEPAAARERRVVAVVLIGDEGLAKSLASLGQSQTPWVLGVLPAKSGSPIYQAADLANFLKGEAADCGTIIFAAGGTTFDPQALAYLDDAITISNATAAAADILESSGEGTFLPILLPADDPELALELGVGVNLFAMPHRVALRSIDGGATSAHGLLAFAADEPLKLVHISRLLATCRPYDAAIAADAQAHASIKRCANRGHAAEAMRVGNSDSASIRIRRTIAAEHVSVFIVDSGQRDALQATVESLRAAQGRHRIDICAVRMGKEDTEIQILDRHNESVFRAADPFNVATALNKAVATVRSRLICFLDAGALIEGGGDYFEDLLSRFADRDVACVGPLLVSPSGFIRAAGLVVGPHFAIAPAFAGHGRASPGYAGLLHSARSCAALPLCGLITKRIDFRRAGGFDPHSFSRIFLSVDYALKLTAMLKRSIFSPHASLLLPDTVGESFDVQGDAKPGWDGELDLLRAKWGRALLVDRWYSPSLAADRKPYGALAWPPRQ